MKYYKLINDIPMFKKGDLFFIHPGEGCLLQKDTLRLAYHKKTLENNPEILKEWFEEIPEKYERWRAERGGRYSYLGNDGTVSFSEEFGDDIDDYRYSAGLYGRTKEELEAKREYDIARQVLLDDAEGGKFIEGGKNWHAFYDTTSETYAIASGMSYYFPGVVCFKNGGSLYKSLNEHKKQWEIVHKYEAGEM